MCNQHRILFSILLLLRWKHSYVRSEHNKPRIEQITPPVDHAEGPHWDAEKQVLLFVDISGGRVYSYNPYWKQLTYAQLDATVGAVIPLKGSANQFLVGRGTDLAVLTWDGESTEKADIQIFNSVDKDKPGNRFNDGKVDPIGRLWIGTMGVENPVGTVAPNRGTLYKMTNYSCQLEPALTKVSISNGMAWSLDGHFMYYIDSPTRKVEVFDYNLITGEISNRRTVIDFDKKKIKGVPDGMTIDRNGQLWVACWGGSQILNIDSKTGEILYIIGMPVERVTSVTFGGPYYDILYVTTMRTGLTQDQLKKQPSAGAVFAISNLPIYGRYNVPAEECPNFYNYNYDWS